MMENEPRRTRPPERCGGMNAPNLDPIELLRPWGTPEEKALRRRLHNASTLAAARATRAQSGAARQLLWLTSQTAASWTFSSRSEAELREMADCLVRLVMCASAFERLEGNSR